MERLSKWGSFATTYGIMGLPIPPLPVPVQLGPEDMFGDCARAPHSLHVTGALVTDEDGGGKLSAVAGASGSVDSSNCGG